MKKSEAERIRSHARRTAGFAISDLEREGHTKGVETAAHDAWYAADQISEGTAVLTLMEFWRDIYADHTPDEIPVPSDADLRHRLPSEEHEQIRRAARNLREAWKEFWDTVNAAEDEIGDAVYPVYDDMPKALHSLIFQGGEDRVARWLDEVSNL